MEERDYTELVEFLSYLVRYKKERGIAGKLKKRHLMQAIILWANESMRKAHPELEKGDNNGR